MGDINVTKAVQEKAEIALAKDGCRIAPSQKTASAITAHVSVRCYYGHHTLHSRKCAMQFAASHQPVRASGGTMIQTFASLVPFPVRPVLWDAGIFR
jgi:hypothetical protein